MAKGQRKVETGEKLGRRLGIVSKPTKILYGPTGHRRKPHNKPLKRPLLGILPGTTKDSFKL